MTAVHALKMHQTTINEVVELKLLLFFLKNIEKKANDCKLIVGHVRPSVCTDYEVL